MSGFCLRFKCLRCSFTFVTSMKKTNEMIYVLYLSRTTSGQHSNQGGKLQELNYEVCPHHLSTTHLDFLQKTVVSLGSSYVVIVPGQQISAFDGPREKQCQQLCCTLKSLISATLISATLISATLISANLTLIRKN